MFAAMSCSYLSVDDNDSIFSDPSKEPIQITIEASISDDVQSRISVSPGEDSSADWTLAWDEDDELILVEVDSYLVCTLAIASIDELTGMATFTGEVAVGEYNIYSLPNYTISDSGQVVVDYSLQGDDCSNPPMAMAGTMQISGGDDYTSISLDHVAQALDLQLSFDNFVADKVYTLHSVVVDGSDYQFGKVVVSTSKELTTDDSSCNLYCYLPGFTVAPEGSITTTATLSDSDGEIYFISATTTNTTGSSIAFEIGNHNYLTAKFDLGGDLDNASWSDNAASAFASGDGTEDDPYMISTAEQLAKLAVDVNAGTYYDGIYFELQNNIDLSGCLWSPIGSEQAKSFKGIFDGGGHTISGLYIISSSNSQALFGCIYGATIKSVAVDGLVSGGNSIAGVVGAAYSSSIVDSCHNFCSVSGGSGVGGVVGSLSASTISYCSNSASVSGSSEVGGVAGSSSNSSTMESNSNFGDVSGGSSVGGVVGLNDSSTVISSSNAGSVDGSSSNVGGVVGYNNSSAEVTFSYNEGEVNGQSTYTGGVVGYNDESSIITSCYNKGEVYGKGKYVGGVVGHNNSSSIVASCYNTGSVDGDSERVGGVVGNSISSTLTCCYSVALVDGSSKVGALVGYLSSTSTISSCYWDEDISEVAAALGSGSADDSVVGMTTSAMQAASFVETLNKASYTYNNTKPTVTACGWVAVDSDYPTLDFSTTPTSSGGAN